MKYSYLQYELSFAKSKPPFAQPKIRTLPNRNPFSPRTNELLPSEITICEIKIAQAKFVFPRNPSWLSPNENPFSPRANSLLPNEISTHKIEITQAKSLLSDSNCYSMMFLNEDTWKISETLTLTYVSKTSQLTSAKTSLLLERFPSNYLIFRADANPNLNPRIHTFRRNSISSGWRTNLHFRAKLPS